MIDVFPDIVASTSGYATVPAKRKQLIGIKYFKHVVITWSIRSRGNVQRTQICTHTSTDAFNKKTSNPTVFARKFPTPIGDADFIEAKTPKPSSQPPRNKTVAKPLTRNMLAYSARKKSDQRKPLYSVKKPATNSLSASARSKGARLQLAVAHVK
jgi:hypothetical protein